MFQETISLDCVIDKLFKQGYNDNDILFITNSIFSSNKKVTVSYLNERRKKIEQYQLQLQSLIQIPKIEQRSEEWHETRKGIITASEFAEALGKGKFRTQKQFFSKKCGLDTEKPNFNAPPLKWGTKYEDVAASLYELRQGLTIHDFGLLRHPYIKHFGASPDGINEYGIMIEIKCPFMRKITGEVPQQYYFQIQGQLSVCNLHECDYLEVEFEEFDNIVHWIEFVDKDVEHGYILEVPTSDELNPWRYIYSDIYVNDNLDETLELCKGKIQSEIQCLDADIRSSVVVKYWTIRHYNIVRVYRDENFLKSKFIELESIWDKVETYRDNTDLFKKDYGTGKRSYNQAVAATDSSLTISPKSANTQSTVAIPSGYAFFDDE